MKERLDRLLVEKGLAPSREKAKAMIDAGIVYLNGEMAKKAGQSVEESTDGLEIRGETLKYVSRGGLKLEKACECWNLSLEGKVCMDIGASTGGFTDCMLQRGAAQVYAVDVGSGQLAQKLRADPRVVNLENTNFRYLAPESIALRPEFVSVDVSFISLTKILLPAGKLLREGGEMVCLVKPQFEAGRERVGKKGVVRSASVHREVIGEVMDFAQLAGFEILHLEYSPIKGPEGNIEYLLHLKKREGVLDGAGAFSRQSPWKERIAEVTKRAHLCLETGSTKGEKA